MVVAVAVVAAVEVLAVVAAVEVLVGPDPEGIVLRRWVAGVGTDRAIMAVEVA